MAPARTFRCYWTRSTLAASSEQSDGGESRPQGPWATDAVRHRPDLWLKSRPRWMEATGLERAAPTAYPTVIIRAIVEPRPTPRHQRPGRREANPVGPPMIEQIQGALSWMRRHHRSVRSPVGPWLECGLAIWRSTPPPDEVEHELCRLLRVCLEKEMSPVEDVSLHPRQRLHP